MENWAMLEDFIEVTPILRPGVYALVKEGAIVYIGQASKHMMTRIESHRSLSRRKAVPGWLPIRAIHFDQIYVLPCRVEDLDRIERAMIDLYKPRFNVKLKAPTLTTTPITIHINGIAIPFNHNAPSPRFERRI